MRAFENFAGNVRENIHGGNQYVTYQRKQDMYKTAMWDFIPTMDKHEIDLLQCYMQGNKLYIQQ